MGSSWLFGSHGNLSLVHPTLAKCTSTPVPSGGRPSSDPHLHPTVNWRWPWTSLKVVLIGKEAKAAGCALEMTGVIQGVTDDVMSALRSSHSRESLPRTSVGLDAIALAELNITIHRFSFKEPFKNISYCFAGICHLPHGSQKGTAFS